MEMERQTESASSALEAVISNFSGMVRRVGWRHRLSEADIDELMQDVRIRLWRAHSRDGDGRDGDGRDGGDGLTDGQDGVVPLFGRDGQSEQLGQIPASYVYRTATTAALDLIRRRRAGRMVSEHDVMPDADAGERVVDFSMVSTANPDRDMEASELAEQVERAIETIPASRRAVVRMYLAGYPREEITELMGWTEGKTRNLLYRGLNDLRQKLTEWGIGTEAQS